MTDVVIVGAGPTGITAANLLADLGVRVTVLEAASEPSCEPRAIALADESLRTAQFLGMLDDLRPDIVWQSGSRYLGTRGQLLVRTQPAVARFGFPVKTLFDQPGYVRACLAAADRRDLVTITLDSRVTGLAQDSAGVRVDVSTPTGIRQVAARYVIGADGGRSTVRQAVDITMAGSSQTHPWIVVDTVNDPHDHGDTEFHCDFRRPHVVVPGTQGRCRYEFMLMPGETAEQVLNHDFLAELLSPYRQVSPADIRRRTVYVAHQLVASTWRAGRVFLAGDAAHLMPPFAGQGLNTGLRDVRNLTWKLAAALDGTATDDLLDTYETERRPHAEAMVRFSYRLGSLVMTGRPTRARLRDVVFQATRVVPPLRRYLAELRFVPRPDVSGGCAVATADSSRRPRRRETLVGTPLPQGQVLNRRSSAQPLDEILGAGWSLVVLTRDQAMDLDALGPLMQMTGARPVLILPGGFLPRRRDDEVWVVVEQTPALPFATAPRFLLVRPDRYVAADFNSPDAAVVRAGLQRYFVAQTSAPAGRTSARSAS